jgi:hypothetical protein
LSEELGPPCSQSELARLQRSLGKPLPPSYRTFMELHNGWSGFYDDAKILAVLDREEAWFKTTMRNLSDLFDEFEKNNPIKNGAFAIMLGKTSSMSLLLDTSKVRPNGEMDLLLFEWTQKEKRFADFGAFLSYEIKRTKVAVERKKEGENEEEVGDEEDEEEGEDEDGKK